MDDDRADRAVRSKHVLEHLPERFPVRMGPRATGLDVLACDLIVFKAIAGRPKDVQDATTLLVLYSAIDRSPFAAV